MLNRAPTASVEPLESRRLMAAQPIGGIGVMGDSFADEYQFYPPDRSTARNFVEQLAASRGLNFGAFDTNSRGEPRNAGFEYDWAKDGATTSDLIAQGQHTGLAAQAAQGLVNYAWIFAGGNDLINVSEAEDPAAALAGVADTMLANGEAAITALLGAKPDIRIVIATVPRLSSVPGARALVASGEVPQSLLDAADQAADAMNAQIKQIAKAEKQVAVADVATLIQQIYGKKKYKVGKVVIDRDTASDAPTSLFLADGLHAGTIGQGLLANVFVKAMKKDFKAKIKPLTTREILANAGLQPNGQPLLTAAPSVVNSR